MLAARMFNESNREVATRGWSAVPGNRDARSKVARLWLGNGHSPVSRMRRVILTPARLADPPSAGPIRSGRPGNPQAQGDAVAMSEYPLSVAPASWLSRKLRAVFPHAAFKTRARRS